MNEKRLGLPHALMILILSGACRFSRPRNCSQANTRFRSLLDNEQERSFERLYGKLFPFPRAGERENVR